MAQLRRLDAAVTQKATGVSLVFGVIGIVLVCLAYPIYNRIIKEERQKIAPEIIRLADELMQ